MALLFLIWMVVLLGMMNGSENCTSPFALGHLEALSKASEQLLSRNCSRKEGRKNLLSPLNALERSKMEEGRGKGDHKRERRATQGKMICSICCNIFAIYHA